MFWARISGNRKRFWREARHHTRCRNLTWNLLQNTTARGDNKGPLFPEPRLPTDLKQNKTWFRKCFGGWGGPLRIVSYCLPPSSSSGLWRAARELLVGICYFIKIDIRRIVIHCCCILLRCCRLHVSFCCCPRCCLHCTRDTLYTLLT